MPPHVRPATIDDVDAISLLYGHAVHTGIATFDTDDPPASHWAGKILADGPGDHVLVVEDDGIVVGFAYSDAFRMRPAYESTRETSIYLSPEVVGTGMGTVLYRRLLSLLSMDGIHVVVAVIALPNPASVALHERLGFEVVGTFNEVGRKFDRWIDTCWYQLKLGGQGQDER